ncbi:MAG TPA: hypothetical protein DIT04_04330, partial [Dysgonomonas sp.]|nr:hypothetical protein [Dysgonomonas sp.]
EIKEGDVVYLKSEELVDSHSRTYMTVGGVASNTDYIRHCYWFANGELKTQTINTRVLKKVE